MNQFKQGRELAESIARFLQGGKWMTWTNQPLGSVLWDHSSIVDVLAIFKSYSNQCVRIYEVKINRSDFLQDVNAGKYLKYMEYCNQFYFAVPARLIKKEELPGGCGLITNGPKGWQSVKAAPRRDFTLSRDMMMALLLKGYQNHFDEYRRLEKERFQDYPGLLAVTYSFGVKVSRDIVESRQYVEQAEELRKQINEVSGQDFPDIWRAASWLRAEVNGMLGKHKYAEEAAELLRISIDMFKGAAYQAPRYLREIADKLEKSEEKRR